MKKIFMLLLIGTFMISFASSLDCWADFDKDTEIELLQICPTCSYVNITSITYPNGTVLLNEEMTQTGVNFNYPLPDSSQKGQVSYGTVGDKNDANPPMTEILCINIGRKLDTSGGILYFLFAFGALALFAFCLYWVFELPSGNNTTKDGEIVSINDWKYLRIFLIPVCYVLLWWLFGIMRSIFSNFLVLDGPHLFFNWGFWIMAALSFPLTIVGLWFFFLTILLDRKIIKSLKSGTPFLNDQGR